MNIDFAVLLIILFPLVGFLINGLIGSKLPKMMNAVIGSGAVLGSFILTAVLFFTQNETATVVKLFTFLNVSGLHVDMAFLIDRLSLMMMMIITGIGFLIHVYSSGYMHDDEGFYKFFAYLNLFIFSMLLLVMGSSYVLMFFGWEGVGLCSYLLIGFWFKNIDYSNAARKAFIMNRIGDLGFLMGMFMLLQYTGSLDYNAVFNFNLAAIPSEKLIAITALLFIGAMGKSAQIPLYTWLPDAMAGPTPVSALIHAATMVTAGIYMVVRSNALYVLAPATMEFIAIIGLCTALFAGTIALFQNDIKKVLAYSTVSQLGYMFLALGVGAFTSGMFHLMTHAFFKALLFLSAGSVIHAMGGEQDITKMGGLSKKIKVTFICFTIGVLAIAGFPFTSGFVSKDEILLAVYQHNVWYFYLAAAGAVMTVYYMFRVWILTFFGTFRGTAEQAHHVHESPISMTFPLMVLAALSLLGGLFQFPHVFGGKEFLNDYLKPVVSNLTREDDGAATKEIIILLATVIGLAIIWFITKKNYAVASFEGKYTGIKKVLADKYYIDEIYEALFVKPIAAISRFSDRIIDNKMVDGVVFMTGKMVTWSGTTLRYIQNGQTGFYLLIMVLAMAAIFAFNIFYKL